MRSSIGQKATRTGILLIGLRDPRIARELERFGFNEEVLAEGWSLFEEVTGHRLDRALSRPSKQPNVVSKVDAFEDVWFPITQIILERHAPEMGAKLFLNLTREEGKSATFMVETFLRRLEEMEKGEAPFGKEGPATRDDLRTRGLTDEVVAEVTEDMERLKSLQEDPAPPPAFDQAAAKAAEEAMWKWYLEWSAIARRVITDGNLLRVLGFKKRRGRSAASSEVTIRSEVVNSTPTASERALAANATSPLALPAE